MNLAPNQVLLVLHSDSVHNKTRINSNELS